MCYRRTHRQLQTPVILWGRPTDGKHLSLGHVPCPTGGRHARGPMARGSLWPPQKRCCCTRAVRRLARRGVSRRPGPNMAQQRASGSKQMGGCAVQCSPWDVGCSRPMGCKPIVTASACGRRLSSCQALAQVRCRRRPSPACSVAPRVVMGANCLCSRCVAVPVAA